jgi:hypothetical protein
VAFTQADLDAVRSAIARGERAVQFADRGVTYRSMEELLVAEEHIAASVAVSSGESPRPKQSFVVTSKGF